MTALWNLVQNSKFSFNWKERLREAPYCKFEQIHQITVIASPKKRNCYSKQLNFYLLWIFKMKIPKSKRYVQRDIGNARWIFWNLNSAAVSPILNQMTFIWHVAEVTGVHWTLFRYFHLDQYFTNISNLINVLQIFPTCFWASVTHLLKGCAVVRTQKINPKVFLWGDDEIGWELISISAGSWPCLDNYHHRRIPNNGSFEDRSPGKHYLRRGGWSQKVKKIIKNMAEQDENNHF